MIGRLLRNIIEALERATVIPWEGPHGDRDFAQPLHQSVRRDAIVAKTATLDTVQQMLSAPNIDTGIAGRVARTHETVRLGFLGLLHKA